MSLIIKFYIIHLAMRNFTTPISVDNSEWMRNGDFIPTRLHAQQDAVNVVARFKIKENAESNVALLTLSEYAFTYQ